MTSTSNHWQSGRLAIALLFVLTTNLAMAAVEAAQPQEISIEIPGATLTAWTWGEGELVIALPGSGADNSRYRYLGPRIASEGYRVVALNQRGIKGSNGALENLTLHDYATDVANVISSLGSEKAHLIGWALGNRIQRTVATDYPYKVASVTLLAAGGMVPATAEPGALDRLLSEANLSLEEKMTLARKTLFSPATSDAKVREFAENLHYWPDARLAQQRANRSTPREIWWAGGAGPMLIVQGLHDLTAPIENGRQMQQQYSERIELVEITDTGHLMGYEKPLETATAIVNFLKKHRF